MPKRALVEHRPWLLASLASALAFYFLRDNPLGGTYLILLKGGACFFLAVYAWQRHKSSDARLIALYLLLSAAGDMALELWFDVGGALFFAAHLAAISLFLKNCRHRFSSSQKAAATALLLATPVICWLLTGQAAYALYGLALGGMAACAWMSRFSRYRVGAGAILFVVSDLLIFAGLEPLVTHPWRDIVIWPIYYSAQFLIATGVIRTLRGDLRASTG